MKIQNVLLAAGAIAGAMKMAKDLAGIQLDDVLGAVGLTRRRSQVLSNIAFLGAGALAGAGAAVLLTPRSGPEARRLIRRQGDRLGQAASEVMHASGEAGRSLASRGRVPLRSRGQKHSSA